MSWQGSRGTRHERGYGRDYMRKRAIVMGVNRDGKPTELCRACLMREGRPTQARECDHIIPKHKADASGMIDGPCGERMHVEDIRNMQPLCSECHSAKTQAEAAEAQGRAYRGKVTIGADGWPTG